MTRTVLFLTLFCAAAHGGTPADYGAPDKGKVRIVRDTFGVPHIIAQDNHSLFFGAGYAQAEDQLVNLVLNYMRSDGRIAEIEGKSQLITDHTVRMLRIPERSKEVFAQLDADTKEQLEGFAAGVNHYIVRNKDQVPEWIDPVEPRHVVSFAMYLDTMFSLGHCRRDLAAAGVELAANLPGLKHGDQFGSNQFAVTAERSAHGACMLSMDPHLRHSGFFRWYEMHLVGPEVNAMGACFFGNPYVTMGRTESTAWCMTVNGPDLGDVFTFDVNPDNPGQYRDIDGWKNFEMSKHTYKIATDPGKSDSIVAQELPALWTELGPVMGVKEGIAYVFALPTSDKPDRAKQSYEMMKAQTMPDFKKAMSRLSLVMFNVLYADKHGDIFYISNGRVPMRDERIPGSQLRPGDQEWARWNGIHPQEDLPQLVNPAGGYVLNTNSGPHNITPVGGPVEADFPDYMISHQSNSRQRRLNHLLSADTMVTFDEMKVYATDTTVEVDPEQLAAVIKLGRAPGPAAEIRQEVASLLEDWDHRTDLESRGAVVFYYLASSEAFVTAMTDEDFQAAGGVMVQVANSIKETFGSLDVPWKEFSRIRRGDIDMGIAGSGGTRAGRLPTSGAALRPSSGRVAKDGRRYCGGGSSYGMIVDFSGDTQAISCLPFGVSEHKDSAHFADMLPLYVKRDFKPVWFEPGEIGSNTESEQVLEAR